MFLDVRLALAASGMFPKMPRTKVLSSRFPTTAGCKVTAGAARNDHQQSGKLSHHQSVDWNSSKQRKQFEVAEPLTGPDPDENALQEIPERVKKVFVYENVPDWTGTWP